MVILCVMLVVIFLHVVCDVNYFLRTYCTIWFGKMFQRNYSLDETTSMYGVCTPRDVDCALRMRPCRVLRALDFARFHFWERTGVHARARELRCGALQSATHLVSLEPIPLFAVYKIETELVYWDARSLLMRHRLTTPRDGRARALLVSRQHVTGAAVAAVLRGRAPPPCPGDVAAWLRAVETLSAGLRK